MPELIRDVRFPIGGTPDTPVYETATVGWRPDAVSDQECAHCWGTGQELRYGRSLNCQRGVHGTCSGHQDPRRCGCFCHEAAAVTHGLTEEKQPQEVVAGP
jgi:hypothetical protein